MSGWRQVGMALRHGALRRWAWQHLPGDCPLCGLRSMGGLLCAGCHADVTSTMHAPAPRCPQCALRLPEPSSTGVTGAGCPDCLSRRASPFVVTAAFDYDGPGRVLIQSLKSQGRFLVAPAVAALMRDGWQRTVAGGAVDPELVIVPVPASDTALRRRGYNPAGELATALAVWLRRPCRHGWLHCVQDGGQTGRSRAARQRDAQGRHRCSRPLNGQPVLLVDDVLTTGSTLDDAARALRAAGAGPLSGVVAARTPWRGAGS